MALIGPSHTPLPFMELTLLLSSVEQLNSHRRWSHSYNRWIQVTTDPSVNVAHAT